MRATNFITIALILILPFTIFGNGLLKNHNTIILNEENEEFVFHSTYSGLILEAGSSVTIPLIVTNNMNGTLNIAFSIASGPNWDAKFKYKGYVLKSIYLLPKETISIDFSFTAPANASQGNYEYVLLASTIDGKIKKEIKISIDLKAKEVVATKAGEVKLSTLYPVLEGTAGSTFQFRVTLSYDGSEERIFNLVANAPPGWITEIRPAYETKKISSIQLSGYSSRDLEISVTAPEITKEGNYTIRFSAYSENIGSSIDLKVVIIGTYKISMQTSTGRLNIGTIAGEKSYLSLIIKNEGTANIKRVTFSSIKPEAWKIVFDPDEVNNLAPGESREVSVEIISSSNTIPGDYSITLRANYEYGTKELDIRVTVSSPPLWGWIGIGIVIAIIAGLLFIFFKFGRR
ncbi:MAG: NEW3 domain-containing protein [Nitrososphaerota archaeon]